MNRSLRLNIAAFAFIRTVFNTMFRMVYPFLPILARGLGVSITTFSLALSGRQIAGMFGPFLAILTESRGRRFGMLTGLGLFTAGVMIVVLWPIFPVFVVSLILTTIGKYMFDPHMHGYLGDQVPYERRGLAVAITELGWSLAFFIGIPITGFLIARGGWISPFWVFAILGIIAIFLITKLIPAEVDDQADWSEMWSKSIQVLRFGPALAGLAIGLWISAANEVINLRVYSQ